MAAAKYNLVIDQGSDFSQTLTIKEDGTAKDLTGYSARAQIRPSVSSDTLTASFTCTIPNPSTGTIVVFMSNTTTKTIAPGRYYYDLELFTSNDATVTRLLQGEVSVTPEVTR